MNDKRDFDRAVDRWLDDGSDATPPEVIDAVLLAVRSTPQERDFRVPWRTTSMTSYLRVAAVIALAVIASTAATFTFGPGGSGIGGTGASPSPSPALLARGNFVTNVGEVVELEATREGSSVTGRMTVMAEGQNGPYAFTVDLQCARKTEDGLIMIGGVTTDSTGREAPQEGTWAGIVLERGSPVGASTWRAGQSGASQAANCLAFLDEQDMRERSTHPGGDWTDPIVGTVELGP
jgi:hypothetical protein